MRKIKSDAPYRTVFYIDTPQQYEDMICRSHIGIEIPEEGRFILFYSELVPEDLIRRFEGMSASRAAQHMLIYTTTKLQSRVRDGIVWSKREKIATPILKAIKGGIMPDMDDIEKLRLQEALK